MQITRHTDYALRLLIFLSLQEKNSLVTIDNAASQLNITKNHLAKVVQNLAQHGYVVTVRGNQGGFCLAKQSDEIILGHVVRAMEMNLEIVDCQKPACPLVGCCDLKGILDDARDAFLSTLDKYNLADITKQSVELKRRLKWS